MKKIFSILTIFALAFLVNSCRTDEPSYSGDPLLLFNAPQSSANTTVTSGGGNATYNVSFGTVKAVDADSDVTLVVDAANSTAKEGVDFIIPNKTVTLKAGTSIGSVPVTLLESTATLVSKSIAFKLTSNTLKNANFNQDFKLNYSLACPFVNTKFNGNYKVVTDTWADYSVGDLVPVVPGTAANQVFIKSTNNTSLTPANRNASYMILTVSPDGSVVVTSNINFDYGGGFVVPVTGTGTVDRCSGDINLSVLNFGTYKNNKFVLKKQ